MSALNAIISVLVALGGAGAGAGETHSLFHKRSGLPGGRPVGPAGRVKIISILFYYIYMSGRKKKPLR